MWGIFTAYMFIASLRTTGAVALVFLLLAITFIVLGIGNSALAGTLHATNGTIKLGGYIGLVTAIAAWYASFAGVINSTFGRISRCRSSRSAAEKSPYRPAEWGTTRQQNSRARRGQPGRRQPLPAPAADPGAREARD